MKKINSTEEYIESFPENIQKLLTQMRSTIIKAAPEAEEVISYGMPGFRLGGMLVFFAAYPNHIGFYPTPSGIDKFKKELATYKGAKGSVQFPIDQQLPLGLITKIVKFRVKENLEKSKSKKGK
ncbi:MAG: iron chaperone [Flavitalea sp.]